MTSTAQHVRRAHYALVAEGTAVMTLEMMSLSGGEGIGLPTKIASAPDTPPSSSSAFLVIDNIPTIVVLADVLRFIEPFLDHILHVKCILPLSISNKDEPAAAAVVASTTSQISSRPLGVSPSYSPPRPLTYSLLCEIRDFVGDATTGMMYGGGGEDEDDGGETLLTFSLERYLETFAEECDGYPLTALMPDVLLALYRVVSSDAVVTLEADAVANSLYFMDDGSSSATNVAESEAVGGTSAAAAASLSSGPACVVLRVPLSELVAAPPAEEEETTATAAQGSSVVGEVQINAHAPTGDDDFGDENGEGTGAEAEEEIDRFVRRDGMMVSSHTSTLFDASTPPLFSEMSSANNTRSNTADMMIGSTQFANEEGEERVEGATFSFSATASGGGGEGPRHKATRQSAGIAKDDTMAMRCASSASSSIASSPSPSASRRTPAATPSSFPTTFGYGHRSGPLIRASSTSPFSHPLQISATTAGGGVGVGVGGFSSQLQASSSSTSPSLSGLPRSVLNRSPMFVLPPAAAAIHVSKVKCVSSARQQQQQASSAAGGDTGTPQGLLGGEEVHIVSDTASLAVDISSDRRGGIFDRSPANSNCPICLETMGTLPCLTTLCGHQFHTHCYTKVGPKCPLCRFEIAALDERYFQLMTYSLPLGHGGQRNDPPTMTGGNGIGHTTHRLAFAPEEEDASEGQAARALRRSEARRDYSQRFPPETTRLDAGAKGSQTCQSSAPDSNKYSCASASQVPLLGSSSPSPPSLSGALKSSIPSRQTIREIFARLSRSTPATQTNASGGREASAGLADPPVGQRHDTTSLWELAHTRRRGSLSGQHHRRPSYSHGSHEGSMNNNDNDFPSLSLRPQSAAGDPQCALCARSSNGLDAAAAHRTKRNNIPIHEDDDDESPITQPPQAVSTNSTGPEEPSTRKGGEEKGGGKTSAPLPTSGPSHPTTRTFWMCLVCGATHGGVTSCGHAYLHYVETGHRFAVDVHAPRVWDYHEGTYVHRLVQQLRMAATTHSLPSAPSAPSLDTAGCGSSSKHGSDSASDRPTKEAAPLPPSSSDRNNNDNDVNDNTTQQSHEDTHGRTTTNKRKKEKEVSYPPPTASSRSISPALAKRNLAEVNGSWSAADTVWVDYGFNDEEQRAQLISSVDFLAEFYSRLLEDQLRAQEEYYQKELASVALGIAVGDLIGEEEARRRTIALEEASDERIVKGLKEITALLREAGAKNKAKAREIVKGSTSGKASTNPSASAAAHQAGKEKSLGGAGSDDAGLEVNEITLAAAEKNLEAVRKLRAAMDAKGASHAKSLKEKDETISKLGAQLESLYAQL